ncbi:MAG: FAD-dependent oxidoreductase [Rhodospirillales bacterium]|nr:FAD-dependent oxidoreductase [Rhodospirillales bacterium]MDE2575060.1 FAD-dependent oxidoreductase [Rhodospirillales bacterium]
MRLTQDSIRRTGRAITIAFDGAPIPAIEGETVAAALSAAGLLTFRHTPSGAPRGLHCGMGACFDCVVTIDGRIGQRACMTKAQDGMAVQGDAPATLAPLAAEPAAPHCEMRACDVLVVGAGPAGLAAAIAAAEAGASVVALDERAAPGGQYHKPLAPSHANAAPDAQFREGAALRARAERAGVTIETEATVWGAFGAGEVAAIIAGRAVTFTPRRLVLAPGAHERPVPLPGWTLPGAMTTGALQTLARAQRVAPDGRVLIAGNGPLNLQLACELLAGGVAVAAVVEAAPRPGLAAWRAAVAMLRTAPGLARQGLSYLATLRRAGVPVLWGSQVTALRGEGRVAEAEIATPAGARTMAIDIAALNFGFQPETGLARALDLPHRFVDSGLGHLATETDAEGRTADPAIFAIGDGAALGGSRVALARGRLAGLAAARDLGLAAPDDAAARGALARAERFQAALWALFRPHPPGPLADATIVCRCEEVTAGRLRAEIAGGLISVAALKKATRAGMGRCQGRFCAATIARLCPDTPRAEAFAAPRVPARPVPAAALMFELEEFEAPLLRGPTPNQRRTPVPQVPPATRHTDILVIGAGAVGLSTAYYLAGEGAEVLIAERDEAGFAASTANAGSLHAQLISYDFDPDGPQDGGPAAHTLPLGPRSIALWREIAGEAGESLGLSTKGGLCLADSEEGMAFLRAKVAMERRWGVETHLIGANELRSIAPHLAETMVGAVFCPAEGRIDPLRGTMALARLAQRRGAALLKGVEVTAIARNGAAWEVETSHGRIIAGRVINCAGPWGGRIAAMVGLDLPVTGTVQQVIVTEPAPRLVEHLVAYAHRHLSLKQQDSGGLLVGGGWFGSYDSRDGRTRNLRRNIEGNLWVAARVLPALRGLSILRAWTGINTAIDRAPILGEAPGRPGFFNAITANGYTLGPIAGRLTADAVLRGAAIDANYRVERFAQAAGS